MQISKNSIIISEDFWCLILNLRNVVIHTIFGKFLNPRLTSPLGPIRYIILRHVFPWYSSLVPDHSISVMAHPLKLHRPQPNHCDFMNDHLQIILLGACPLGTWTTILREGRIMGTPTYEVTLSWPSFTGLLVNRFKSIKRSTIQSLSKVTHHLFSIFLWPP